jgi:hypothetical protein
MPENTKGDIMDYISIVRNGVTIRQFQSTQEVEAKAYAAQIQAEMRYGCTQDTSVPQAPRVTQ